MELFSSLKALVVGFLDFVISSEGESLKERFLNHNLIQNFQKTDAKVHESLMRFLSDSDYDIIDKFFAENGVYLNENITADFALIDSWAEIIIGELFVKYPELKTNKKTYSPVLKQVIKETYQALISKLSIGERVLYNQGQRNHEQTTRQLADITNDLKKLAKNEKKLSYPEMIEMYGKLTRLLLNGYFNEIESLIVLFENQIHENDRGYCTALKIIFHSYCSNDEITKNYCIQLERDECDESLLISVASVLIQTNNILGLEQIRPLIHNNLIADIIDRIVLGNWPNAISLVLDEHNKLKEEYSDAEFILWVYAEYNRKLLNKFEAYKCYYSLEKINPTLFVKWRLLEMDSFLKIGSVMYEINNSMAFQSIVLDYKDRLLTFSPYFELMKDFLCSDYVDSLLSIASKLTLDKFDDTFSNLSRRMQEFDSAKIHWYLVRFKNCEIIDVEKFNSFCERTNNKILWCHYLNTLPLANPDFVLEQIENNPELLNIDFSAIEAYHQAKTYKYGNIVSYDCIKKIKVSDQLLFKYNIFLACLSLDVKLDDECDAYLQSAIDSILSFSGILYIDELRILINILMSRKRFDDANKILEKYQYADPSIMYLRLKVLMTDLGYTLESVQLISQLEEYYHDNADFVYIKGLLEERKMSGAGLEYFEEAFHINSSVKYAKAILNSRLARNNYNEDDVLTFSSSSNDVDLLHLSGLIYQKKGKYQFCETLLLQALVNSNNKYHEQLYKTYTNRFLSEERNIEKPNNIDKGTCCTICRKNNDELKIWIHDDNILIPNEGSNFANYMHLSPNSTMSLYFIGMTVGDEVIYNNESYEVLSIDYGVSIAMKYCMQELIEHGVIKMISTTEDDISKLFDELRESGKEHSQHILNIIEMYKNCTSGFTIDLFSKVVSREYFKTLYSILNDHNISFWAGISSVDVDSKLIITESTIGVLSSLEVMPLVGNENKYYILASLREQIDLETREHRSDKTVAILGFNEDEQPFLIKNEMEDKQNMNRYFACINSWANSGEMLDSIPLMEYPEEFKQIIDAIGISNADAIIYAEKNKWILCCDDLMLRKYVATLGINTITSVDLMIYLGYSLDYIIEKIEILLEKTYIFPITSAFLIWVTNRISEIVDEKQYWQTVEKVHGIVKTILNDGILKNYFIFVYCEVEEDIAFKDKIVDRIVKNVVFELLKI